MTTEPLISRREKRLLQPLPSTVEADHQYERQTPGSDSVDLPSRTTMKSAMSVINDSPTIKVSSLTFVIGRIFGRDTVLELDLCGHLITRAVLRVALSATKSAERCPREFQPTQLT